MVDACLTSILITVCASEFIFTMLRLAGKKIKKIRANMKAEEERKISLASDSLQ